MTTRSSRDVAAHAQRHQPEDVLLPSLPCCTGRAMGAVPAGDTRVWTGEYGYHAITCTDQAMRDAACVDLRVSFRGVRWSVSVHDYVVSCNMSRGGRFTTAARNMKRAAPKRHRRSLRSTRLPAFAPARGHQRPSRTARSRRITVSLTVSAGERCTNPRRHSQRSSTSMAAGRRTSASCVCSARVPRIPGRRRISLLSLDRAGSSRTPTTSPGSSVCGWRAALHATQTPARPSFTSLAKTCPQVTRGL